MKGKTVYANIYKAIEGIARGVHNDFVALRHEFETYISNFTASAKE